ncbi:UNVERIFIED_CONTAM: Cyclin-dependent protein kinase inhibitor SMR14 [Sesamum indicum]
MCTDFKPVSLMGLSSKMTSEDAVFLPEKKDFHAFMLKGLHHDQEASVVVRPEADKTLVPMPVLKIKLQASAADDDGEDGGIRTPTSVDHMRKNVIVLKCPPAPRKPKSLPSTKRKAESHERVHLLDLSDEIQSLFPPNILKDFVRGKIRKVSKESIGFN